MAGLEYIHITYNRKYPKLSIDIIRNNNRKRMLEINITLVKSWSGDRTKKFVAKA